MGSKVLFIPETLPANGEAKDGGKCLPSVQRTYSAALKLVNDSKSSRGKMPQKKIYSEILLAFNT